jgi:hypothetical protein
VEYNSHSEQTIIIYYSWTKSVQEKYWIGNFPSNISTFSLNTSKG